MKLGKDADVASMTIIEPKDPASSAHLNGLSDVPVDNVTGDRVE